MESRSARISCDRCPVTLAIADGGDFDVDETCNPKACPAAALSSLPNMSLWQWFGEILAMESTGLDITSLALAWPITVLRAFTALRAAILSIEKKKAEAERNER